MHLHLCVGDDCVYCHIHIGFTMVAAAGPFTTSDSLEMGPLKDLLKVVAGEKPDALVLVSRRLILYSHELNPNQSDFLNEDWLIV